MTIQEDLVKIMQGMVGTVKEDLGENRGTVLDQIVDAVAPSMKGQPPCAIQLSYAMLKAAEGKTVNAAYKALTDNFTTAQFRDEAIAMGAYRSAGTRYEPTPGDHIRFQKQGSWSGHIGMVTFYNAQTGEVKFIGGNQDDETSEMVFNLNEPDQPYSAGAEKENLRFDGFISLAAVLASPWQPGQRAATTPLNYVTGESATGAQLEAPLERMLATGPAAQRDTRRQPTDATQIGGSKALAFLRDLNDDAMALVNPVLKTLFPGEDPKEQGSMAYVFGSALLQGTEDEALAALRGHTLETRTPAAVKKTKLTPKLFDQLVDEEIRSKKDAEDYHQVPSLDALIARHRSPVMTLLRGYSKDSEKNKLGALVEALTKRFAPENQYFSSIFEDGSGVDSYTVEQGLKDAKITYRDLDKAGAELAQETLGQSLEDALWHRNRWAFGAPDVKRVGAMKGNELTSWIDAQPNLKRVYDDARSKATEEMRAKAADIRRELEEKMKQASRTPTDTPKFNMLSAHGASPE